MANIYKLEEFSESDLLVNITHHVLVPKHEILNPEEKRMMQVRAAQRARYMGSEDFKWEDLLIEFRDVKLWLRYVAVLCTRVYTSF